MKKSIVVALSLLLVILAAGLALAEDKAEAAEKPDFSKMDGKELYKMMCKQCHGAEAEAGEYTPMSLIGEQWEEFFDEGFAESHKAVVCPSDPKAMVADHFSKDLLEKIRKFCVDHAADSEQPMTCG